MRKNGSIFDGFMLILFIIALLVSQFGILIHGGIYWGRIRNIFNHIEKMPFNKMHKLPLYSLLSWIFAFCLPLIAPLVTGSLVIHNTSKSKCSNGKSAFLAQLTRVCQNQSPTSEDYKLFNNFKSTMFQNKYYNCSNVDLYSDKLINDWFKSNCDEIHTYFWIWIGLRIFCFGGLILILIITFLIAITPKLRSTKKISNRGAM